MIRRAFAVLFALLLAAHPLLGLAAQAAPACSHCPTTVKTDDMPCHQHATSLDKCHQCAGCAACAVSPYAPVGTRVMTQPHGVLEQDGYRPAHFYHLTSPLLDRPPSRFPA
jgi:hypothetical protein